MRYVVALCAKVKCMSAPISRRRFFGRVGAVATGTLLAGGMTLPRWARAIQPISRNGKPKFKFSLAAYSYRGLLSGKDAELSLVDFIDDCAEMGLEGTELTSYYFPQPVTHDYLRSLKRHAFRLGLGVSGTAVGNDFGHPPGEERMRQLAHVKQWIDFAEILGAPVIRIFAGHRKSDMTDAAAHMLMVEAMEEVCEYAGAHGIHLALENHGGPTATAAGLMSFVRDVNSPWFGVNLDTGNFHSDDLYGEIEKLAPYALNVQVKVVVAGSDREKKPTDFERLAKILTDSAYRGYIVLEYEEKGDPRKECPAYVKKLREAFV
jgi:sugar phosphate isomerase/epimerase